MKTLLIFGLLCGVCVGQTASVSKKSPREALQAFNDLIGGWKGTATPAGTREEQQNGFWIENLNWQWKFRGEDAWIHIDFAKSRYFVAGQLRYLPEADQFELTLQTTAKEKISYRGTLTKKVLTVVHAGKDEKRRLVFTLLHPNRFLYRYETLPRDKKLYTRVFQVGATKEGVAFAVGDGKPECIVSGGAGTIAVTFEGQTYYVCCSGCRDEFNENPRKYVMEYNDKKKRIP